MANELVSVIMPAYNAGKYIADAIDSVIRQTYAAWELIVVDDGSTDNTANIIKEYLGRNDQIKFIQRQRGGPGKARNTALLHAQGEYVAFLDADDYWVPEKLYKQVEAMHRTNADLVFSDANVFKDESVNTRRINTHRGYFHGKEAIPIFLSANQVPILTVLAKKSSVFKLKGFSETPGIAEDYDLWLRMLDDGQVFFGIDSPLAYYRVHAGSSSSGEANVLLTGVNTLRNFSSAYSKYKVEANRSIVLSIDEYLANNNISNWKLASQLIEARNQLAINTISASFWQWIYTLFGKKIFRMALKRRLRHNLRK
jgi:glycosyltransferase involved in cell wall biosynthesis